MAATAAIAPLPAAWAGTAPAATGKFGFQASGYGSQVAVSTVVQSGKSALSTLGCTATVGTDHTNTAAGVTAAALTTGTVDTSAQSQSTGSGVASVGTSTIQNVSVLGGLVSATAVQSESTTSYDSSTGALSISPAGTEFTNLTVAGVPVGGTPAANTKLTLPGVGYVILNQQSGHAYAKNGHLTVIGLHVVVTLTTPLAAVGTNVIVGFASSSLGGPVKGLLNGLAYGAHANVLGGTLIAGEAFPQALGCIGTNGATKTNSGLALAIPAVLTSGTVTDSVAGISNKKSASATVSSTVQGLNLGNGLVTATAVQAAVGAKGVPPSFTDTSTFDGLAVQGFPGLGSSPPPNTKLALPGIGTLWLHKVVQTSTSIKVIMIQLDVTAPGNPLGLAVNTQVNVAYASAGIH